MHDTQIGDDASEQSTAPSEQHTIDVRQAEPGNREQGQQPRRGQAASLTMREAMPRHQSRRIDGKRAVENAIGSIGEPDGAGENRLLAPCQPDMYRLREQARP